MVISRTKKTFSGISNPFALAEVIQGKRINWGKKPYAEKRKTLEKVFEMPYHELFDPRMGSPLFRYDTLDKKNVLRAPSYGFGGQYIPPAGYRDFSGVPDKDTWNIRDVVQGSIPNCWLVASLASLAWMNKINYSIITDSVTKEKKYQFTFNGGAKPDTTSSLLPVDANGSLMYCRSYTANELWPALYEKAYVQWREKTNSGSTPEKPDYSKYGDTGDAMTGLSHLLTNQTQSRNMLHSPLPDEKKSLSDNRYLEVYQLTGTCRGLPLAVRRIQKPAIAWTYDTRIIPSDYKNILNTDSYPVYDTNTLPSSHCYTIMGTYGLDTDAPDRKYIILRNPYGPPAGDPNMNGILTAGTFCDSINLADKDGIFGISATEFVKKFEGFGWAV